VTTTPLSPALNGNDQNFFSRNAAVLRKVWEKPLFALFEEGPNATFLMLGFKFMRKVDKVISLWK
jgi:hypothetical protein